jgi:CubicO group peptidase (beta-lactamase class C family)
VVDRIAAVRQRLGRDLPRLAAMHEVPGVSVAVLVDGRQVVEHVAGVVNLRTAVAVTPDSLFMIQSITKVWTATLVMQLVDDDLVELDAPVRAYLPGFRTADERASREITVRHLLSHTGGFEGDIWAATTAGEDALQRFVDDHVSGAAQYTRPGEMYSYCSAGYGVLGRLLEVLRQMPYASVLRRFLAEPLGISELAFSADEALAFRTAIGHARPTPDAAQQPLRVWAVMPPSNPAAGNQLAMSTRGLLAFARMHLTDGLAQDGTRVLSQQSVRAMRERQVDHPAAVGAPSGQGLGWMLPNRPRVVEHGGDTIGVAALLRMVPHAGVAVAMLTNGGTVGPLIDELVEPLLGDISGVAAAPGLPSPHTEALPSDLTRYLGRYETRTHLYDVTLAEDGRIQLTQSARNEGLTMYETAAIAVAPQRHDVRWVGGDTFMLTDPSGAPLRAIEFFATDANGRAQLLHIGRIARRSD